MNFSRLLKELGVAGEFDPHSVAVEGKDPATKDLIPMEFRLSEHYKYGHSGNVFWLIPAPAAPFPSSIRLFSSGRPTAALSWPSRTPTSSLSTTSTWMGESSGLIHLYENTGTKLKPSFKPPVWVEAGDKPLRIYRDGVFGGKHWHGMADYTGDGLEDLIALDGRVDIVATQSLFGADQRSLLYLKNIGTPESAVLAAPEAMKLGGKDIRYSSHGLQPSFVDFEGDGNLDFIGCNESGLFILIRHAALSQPKPEVIVGKPRKR